MKKFLWSLVMCLCVALCSATFTSCSSDDDTPQTGGQTTLLGTWQLTAVSGTEWEDGVTTEITLTEETENVGWVFTPTYFFQFDDIRYKHFDIGTKDWVYTGGVIKGTYIEWDGRQWQSYGDSDGDNVMVKKLTTNTLVVQYVDNDEDEGYNVTMTFTKTSDNYDYWNGDYITD